MRRISTTCFALLGSVLGGCATLSQCGLSGCAGDAAISAAVSTQFARYPALAANSIRIQTLDKVVYLTGVVDTEVERSLAQSVAGDVAGVARVVDSISINNVSR